MIGSPVAMPSKRKNTKIQLGNRLTNNTHILERKHRIEREIKENGIDEISLILVIILVTLLLRHARNPANKLSIYIPYCTIPIPYIEKKQ